MAEPSKPLPEDRGIAAAIDASKRQADETAQTTAGGGFMGEPAMELERMRQREQRMRETQEQFVGAPSIAAEARGELPTEETGAERQPEAEVEEAEEETAPEAETERALLLAQQQAAAQAQLELAREQALQEMRQKLQRGQTKPSPILMWMANLAFPIWWNVQLINAYFFKDKRIPRPSFEKQVAILNADGCACFSQLIVPPCGCLVALGVLYALLALFDKYILGGSLHIGFF